MATSEGPTAAVMQAMNLPVNESVNKVQTEPLPLSSNSSSSNTPTTTTAAAATTALAPVPSLLPENVPKPAIVTTASETTPTVTTTTTLNNSAPNIPSVPSEPQDVPENTDAKPANGPEPTPEPAPEPAPATEMDTSDPPKAPVSADSVMETTKPAEVPENLSQAKAPETINVVKETLKQSCDNDNAAENKMNCETALPPAMQEKKTTSEEKESVKIPPDGPAATSNGGVSKTNIPLAQIPSVSKPVATIKPMVDPAATSSVADDKKSSPQSGDTKTSNKRPAEDSNEPDKRLKTASSPPHPSSSSGYKSSGKTPEQILEYMEKTFDHRRKIITKQMPTIPELKEMYPDLFRDKQLVIEFQRITKIDIDQKVQEFCVRNATAVIEMARSKKGAAPVLARWEQAKQENEALKQYWDMVTALCLLPLHFGENFVEMVLEIGEDEEVQAQGKIVPTLIARGNIFRTDEFFLIAENTIVQEFEEFTIAFASLYSSYWVFNMVYPETIENTYNFIQRCIVKQKEPGAIPTVCKNFTKTLQKWNKTMKKT